MMGPIPSPIWQPAAQRIIPLVVMGNLRTRGVVPDVVARTLVPKSASDILDYYLDVSEWLKGTGDYLQSVSVTSAGSNFDILCVTLVNGFACVIIGGGNPGIKYTFYITVFTQQGRKLTQPLSISILPGLTNTPAQPVPTLPDGTPVPPNAIRLPDGSILTDDNGQPYIIA